MINLSVFKYPMFTLGTAMMFLSILVILSTGILLPMYLKGALLFSAAVAGLLLLPGNAVNVIMSPIVGALFDKIGPKKLAITGSIIVLIGNIIFVTAISATTPAWQITVAFMVLFFGLTMVTIPAQTNGLNALPRELYADGSAAMNTLNQVAGAAGTAIAITLFTAGQTSFAAGTPDATQGEILAAGIKYAFYFVTGISVVALICSLFMKKPSEAKRTITNNGQSNRTCTRISGANPVPGAEKETNVQIRCLAPKMDICPYREGKYTFFLFKIEQH